MCVSILFLYIVCVYAVNVRGVSKVPNNYIKNKVEDYKLINFLNDLKLSNNFFVCLSASPVPQGFF